MMFVVILLEYLKKVDLINILIFLEISMFIMVLCLIVEWIYLLNQKMKNVVIKRKQTKIKIIMEMDIILKNIIMDMDLGIMVVIIIIIIQIMNINLMVSELIYLYIIIWFDINFPSIKRDILIYMKINLN